VVRQFLFSKSSEDIKSKQAQGVLFDTHIIVNPSNTREWIVLLKKGAGTSFFLVDDQEQVESFADLNGLIEELRLLGIKGAEIHL
tara:strand:- start:10586 stop:10840 length:255 start_codon:yes stop_codon:yes gene_type:complete